MELRGIVSSQELQDSMGKSQATVSRLLAGLRACVIPIGRARAARYGLLKSIHGSGRQQPIWWTTETGEVLRYGTLSFLDGELIHVDADSVRAGGGMSSPSATRTRPSSNAASAAGPRRAKRWPGSAD